MASPDRAYIRKRDREVAFPGHKRAASAYVAEIVSLSDIRRHKRGWRGWEEVARWIASQQLGLVTTEQLQVGGVHRSAIVRRAASGLLHRMYRAVYLVGHPIPPPGAFELGAVLACGARTFVSGRAAAGLWGMIAVPDGPVDVTVVCRHCESRDNIRVHRTDHLDGLDRRSVRGIPVTAPARTLIDLAATTSIGELERALNEARAQRLITDREIRGALERAGRRAGTAALRKLLEHETESGFTRKEAERLMNGLIRDAGLQSPRRNQKILGYEVDFCWAEQKVIVEVDGYQFHGHRAAFERDRRKDQLLTAAGYIVIRVTWRQLREEPIRLAAVISAALTARRPPG